MSAISPVTLSTPHYGDTAARTTSHVPWRGLRLTFAGLLFIIVDVMIGLAALNSEANQLFLLFGLGIGMLILNAYLSLRMVGGIEVQRLFPGKAMSGQPFAMSYLIRNTNQRRSRWSIAIRERHERSPFVHLPRGYVVHLPPGEQMQIDLQGFCSGRTRIQLRGVEVSSRFPFSLFACNARLKQVANLTCLPAIKPLPVDLWRDRRFSQSSNRTANQRSQSEPEEFFGVREYHQGDNVRWIHWRRSAHTGDLIVREMAPPQQTQLLVLLDPWAEDQRWHHDRNWRIHPENADSEKLISLAASIICDALSRTHLVALLCQGRQPRAIPPASGAAHRQRLLSELASLAPGANESFDQLIQQARWASQGHRQCLILTSKPSPVYSKVLGLMRERYDQVILLHPQLPAFNMLLDSAQTKPDKETAS